MSTILAYIITWLQEFGYPILWFSIFIGAIGIPLPNSLLLLAAGAFAEQGDYNIVVLILVTVSAFVTGDTCGYLIGKRWGSRLLVWLEKSGKVRFIRPQTIERSRNYFHKSGGWAVFLSRFLVSGLGGVINLLAGAELYPYRKFILYDICGEVLGTCLPLFLGYIFGESWDAIGDILGSVSTFILASLVTLFLGYQTFKLFRRMRQLKKNPSELEKEQSSMISPRTSSPLQGPDTLSSSSGHLPL